MLAKISTLTCFGLDGHHVDIESDLSNSLPGLSVIGLVGKSVDEAKERIKSAIKNSQLQFPAKRITLSLAPADLPKQGSHFDLAMAVSILAATGQIPHPKPDWLFFGELSLDGTTRPTQGAISAAVFGRDHDFSKMFIASANASAAAIVEGIEIIPVSSLAQLHRHLIGEQIIESHMSQAISDVRAPSTNDVSIDDIYGQYAAKRALSIAIAGNHNMIMSGTPGGGKTMLARAAVSLLPQMSQTEAIEVARIHNLAGLLPESMVSSRPFRAPHHSTSHIGLVGGGSHPRPGEISLAHNGVLFLDEFAEFSRQSLETLRQPLENGHITISRARANLRFPANFMLIAAHNPCPCGYLYDESSNCTCSPAMISRYSQKISGPLLDRIDLKIWVSRIESKDFNSSPPRHLSSEFIGSQIKTARQIQLDRYRDESFQTNAKMNNKAVQKYCQLDKESNVLLSQASTQLRLSVRSIHKILMVSRTIADMAESNNIELSHLSESLQYRQH